MIKKIVFTYEAAIVLIAFGLVTLYLSSSVIFDWFGMRAKEGNYVLFVVWANFISSILYLAAAYGFIKQIKMTFHILSLSASILIIAFVGLFIHIFFGGIYEIKTIGAMTGRIILTLAFVLFAYLKFNKNDKHN